MQVKTTGPAAGSGYEVILQAFNWESAKEAWYKKLLGQVGTGGGVHTAACKPLNVVRCSCFSGPPLQRP